jgi:hypothetical protein
MPVLTERFPRWVESVELLPASARYTALHQAAEGIGATLERSTAVDLVAYAVGRGEMATFEAVCAAVAVNDPSFNASASDLEPHLVASAALARSLENDDLTAAVVAGGVLSAEFSGLFSPIPELPALARATQDRRFARLRERVAVPRLELESMFRDLSNFAVDGWRAAEAVDQLAGATRTLAEQLEQIIAALAQRFELRMDAADEELDVLWWTFAAHGASQGAGWTDAYTPDVLLRAGLGLADRHRFEAEIPTAREILRRVLGPRADEDYVLADVVAAAAGRVALDSAPPGPLFPILSSNAASVALQGGPEWVAAAGRLGVDPLLNRRGDEIAAQTLRELLLARAIAT